MRIRPLVVWLVLIIGARIASAELIDLAPYARVTASATKNTFLGLWPRETDDAPYTVRDSDADTAWKIPDSGTSDLILDFAPLSPAPAAISRFEAAWTDPPAGPVQVSLYAYCGGPKRFQETWSSPLDALTIHPPIEARCAVLSVTDPQGAALVELHVFADGPAGAPNLMDVSGEALDDGWRVSYEPAGTGVHHVRVDYRLESDPAQAIFVVNAPPFGSIELPRPVFSGVQVVLTPVTASGAEGPAATLPISPKPSPAFASSGVVEGFYGRPWSGDERRRLLMLLARLDMGIYIYGPKDDPLHRDNWRAPYDEAALDRFEEWRELGAWLGVTFSFGISPGIDMVLDDPDERATLVAKLAPFVERGFRHFTLLFDDIEFSGSGEIDGTLGAAHADLCNWLRSQLSDLAGEDVSLWLVPTVYSDLHTQLHAGGNGYLNALAALEPSIGVMWTGTGVFSLDLGASDLVNVTARTGRKPIIWDNEFATDGGDGFVGKVAAAPYVSRRPDLPDAAAGIVQNPSILGSVNRLVLGSVAAYLRDPDQYDPIPDQRDSIRLEAIMPRDNALARRLAQTFYGNGAIGIPGLDLPYNPWMDSAIEAMRGAIASGSREAILRRGYELARVGAEMATIPTRMHHSGLAPALVDDLWFPSKRLYHEGHALLWMARWLGDTLEDANGEDTTEDGAAVQHSLGAALHDRYQLSLFRVQSLWNDLRENPPPATGFAEPLILSPATAPVESQPWVWEPVTPDVTNWAVFGLPGVLTSDRNIRWTPTHTGTYTAIVVAENEWGYAWKEFAVVVSEPGEDEPDDDGADDESSDDASDDDADGADEDTNDAEGETGGCGCACRDRLAAPTSAFVVLSLGNQDWPSAAITVSPRRKPNRSAALPSRTASS